MKTLKEVLQNPPLHTYQHFPDIPQFGFNIDYNLWCQQVRAAAVRGILCTECGKETERAELDAWYIDDYGPFCNQCYYEFDEDMQGV